MKPFYRFCHFILGSFLKLLYRHKTFGIEHVPPGKAVIAPNHLSFLDPPLVGISSPEEVYFLAKEALFHNPLFGWMIKNLNALPVSGNAADLKSIKSLVSHLGSGEKVIIFPEGRRTSDGKLTSIKPGVALIAARSKAPVIPTFIHGTFEIWPRQNTLPKLWGKTACVFGSPIYPENYSHLDKKQAQAAISQEIKDSIENLGKWYHSGAKGTPP